MMTPLQPEILLTLLPPQAGTTLQQLTSTTEALTLGTVSLLVVFAVVSILPVLYRDRYDVLAMFTCFDSVAHRHYVHDVTLSVCAFEALFHVRTSYVFIATQGEAAPHAHCLSPALR